MFYIVQCLYSTFLFRFGQSDMSSLINCILHPSLSAFTLAPKAYTLSSPPIYSVRYPLPTVLDPLLFVVLCRCPTDIRLTTKNCGHPFRPDYDRSVPPPNRFVDPAASISIFGRWCRKYAISRTTTPRRRRRYPLLLIDVVFGEYFVCALRWGMQLPHVDWGWPPWFPRGTLWSVLWWSGTVRRRKWEWDGGGQHEIKGMVLEGVFKLAT